MSTTAAPPPAADSRQTRQTAAVVLDVLAGQRRPQEAATALPLSLPRS